MKRFWTIFGMTVVGVCAIFAQNTDSVLVDTTAIETSQLDTVYLYRSWNSVFSKAPIAAYSGHIVYRNNPLEFEIYTNDAESQTAIDLQTIIVNIGDTLWLANANYLLRSFNCPKYDGFTNYMPLYFNSKIALVQYWDDYPFEQEVLSVRPMGEEMLTSVPIAVHQGNPTFYYLDFIHKRILPLDNNVLLSLMECYPDLHTRYKAMKRQKSPEVFDFFLQKYLQRLEADDEALSILEQIKMSK